MKATTSKKSSKKHVATAMHTNDAWGVEWDCNTDALDLEEEYKRGGKKLSFLARHVNDDDNKYSNNACRAACYLICRDHVKTCTPEIAHKALSFMKYLATDTRWLSEMHGVGDIKSELVKEMKRVKELFRESGELGDEIEKYNAKNGAKYSYATTINGPIDLEAIAAAAMESGMSARVVGG